MINWLNVRTWPAALTLAVFAAGAATAPPPPATPPAKPKAPEKVEARSAEAIRGEFARVLLGAREAADAQSIKAVVVLPSLGREQASAGLRMLLQDELLGVMHGGPEVGPPPAGVKAVPAPLTPVTLSRLNWPKATGVPAVMAIVAGPRKADAFALSLTLLDGKRVMWESTFDLTGKEAASLPVVPPANQKIVLYALGQKGQQVGNGECWTLANEAYKSVGVRRPGADPLVWGRPLVAWEQACPGDVIQFAVVRLASGITLGAPQHTAVIKEVVAPGVYVVLHQNMGGSKLVVDGKLDMNTKVSGEYVVYRPLPGASAAAKQ